MKTPDLGTWRRISNPNETYTPLAETYFRTVPGERGPLIENIRINQ